VNPFISQRFTTYNDGRIFNRVNNNGVWTEWKELFATTATTQYTDIVLINNAQPYSGAGYTPPQFAKVGNQVYVRGEISAAFAPGQIIGYLPAGYRPSRKHRYIQSTTVTTPYEESIRLSIDTNGAIRLDGAWGQEGSQTEAYALHTPFLI